MEKEEIEKLGFTKEASWESEEAEKKFLYDKISKLKERAQEHAKRQAEYKRSKMQEQQVIVILKHLIYRLKKQRKSENTQTSKLYIEF